jgi:hypothetical protein
VAGTEAKLFDGDRHGSPDEVNRIFLIRTSGFDSVTATAGPGDTALLYGTSGNEHYVGTPRQGVLAVPSGAVYAAVGFEQTHTVAKRGDNDTAELYGSAEADRFVGNRVYGRLAGSGWMQRAVRYDEVTVGGEQGDNIARLDDSIYTDLFHGTPTVWTYATGRTNFVGRGFVTTKVTQDEEGRDEAHLWPADVDDEIIERARDWIMRCGDSAILVNKSFGEIHIHPVQGLSSQQLGPLTPWNRGRTLPGIADEELAVLAYEWLRA